MSTDLKDASGVTLTPEEAKEVFELWAKRQADTEALRARLSVKDMAEAMAISPAEVEEILATVRSQQSTGQVQQLPPLKKVRPVNTFLIAFAAVAWLIILIGAGISASRAASGGTRETSMPQPASVDTVAPEPFELRDLGRSFSKDLTVVFENTKIKGLAGSGNPLQTESLKQIVDSVWPVPPMVDLLHPVTDSMLISQLRSGKVSEGLSDIIAFKEMVLRTSNGKLVSGSIPVSLTQNGRILRFVREEQERRLRILVNDAAQQLDF